MARHRTALAHPLSSSSCPDKVALTQHVLGHQWSAPAPVPANPPRPPGTHTSTPAMFLHEAIPLHSGQLAVPSNSEKQTQNVK